MVYKNLPISLKKSQWFELIGSIAYIISSIIYITYASINNGTVLYLVASVLFLFGAIFLLAQSVYLICKIHIKKRQNYNESFSIENIENIV